VTNHKMNKVLINLIKKVFYNSHTLINKMKSTIKINKVIILALFKINHKHQIMIILIVKSILLYVILYFFQNNQIYLYL